MSPYPIRSDAPLVWYCVVISVELLTVLVRPAMSAEPQHRQCNAARKPPFAGGAGAEDDVDDDVPAAGSRGGLCCASGWACWPSAQYTHKMAHILKLQVSSDNPPGKCLIQRQFNLNNLIRSTPASGYVFVCVYLKRHLYLKVTPKASFVSQSLVSQSLTRISMLHSYLKASLISQRFGRIELRSAAGRQHPENSRPPPPKRRRPPTPTSREMGT